jgi:CBS domain-containing membrane protein
MNIKHLFHWLAADPINLGIKAKCLAVLSSFTAIIVTAGLSQSLVTDASYPVLVASMGASAVILFILPGSPLAQPWPLVGGQLVSAAVGVACAQLIPSATLAMGCAVGGSILAMLLTRCLHPPGAATALVPAIASGAGMLTDYQFVLMPVAVNVGVLLLLLMAIAINRWLLHYDYPAVAKPGDARQTPPLAGVSPEDIQLALANMGRFVDISTGDLGQLLGDAQLQSFRRQSGGITCADIMANPVYWVEYGTDVEEAWRTMHDQKLNALPVVDRARRVIGIITWHDFFKFIQPEPGRAFAGRFLAFIHRTRDIATDKPESVGHIMTSPVCILQANSHIAELVPLMSLQGYRQIPVVNDENRLVGMVYQDALIAALYTKGLGHGQPQP